MDIHKTHIQNLGHFVISCSSPPFKPEKAPLKLGEKEVLPGFGKKCVRDEWTPGVNFKEP